MYGLVLMYILSRIDYKKYKHLDKLAYGASILILLAVLIPNVGAEHGGARRWIEVPGLNFQPSELAKIGLVIFFASYLTDNRDKLEEKKEGFFKPILMFLAPVILILIGVQSHLSASVLIIAVVCIMMVMAGVKLRYFLTYGSLRSSRSGRCVVFNCKSIWKRWIQIG